jgi:serralysin
MPATDLVFLQDLTGSFIDDLQTINSQNLFAGVVNQLSSPYLAPIFGADLQFGLASFKDKPFSPLGGTTDYVYKKENALTTSATLIKNTYAGFVATGGADTPESQLESLLHAALGTNSIGYRAGSTRLVTVITDATYHVAGDLAAISFGTVANNLDGVINLNEDYPSIAGVRFVLESQNVTPLFLVTSDVKADYDDLVSPGKLGRGIVVTLDNNSANIVDAIKYAVAKSNGTISPGGTGTDGDDNIDADSFGTGGDKVVFSGGGNDTVDLFGVSGNHFIDGGAGFDVLYGGIGQDKADGGSGDDNLYGGSGNDILFGGGGSDVLRGQGGNDILQGGSGNDDLFGGAGNDRFVFDTGLAFATTDLGVDSIKDFRRLVGNTDKIELSRDTFTLLPIGPSLAAANFASVANDALAGTSAAKIVYSTGTRSLFYNQNGLTGGFGSGGSFATFDIAAPTLIASDFVVVD